MVGASLEPGQMVAAYRHGVAHAAAFDEVRARAVREEVRPGEAAAGTGRRFSRFAAAMDDPAGIGALRRFTEMPADPVAETGSHDPIRPRWWPRVLWLAAVAAAGVGVSVLVSAYFVARPFSALPPASASSATAPARAATQAYVAAVRAQPDAIAARPDVTLTVALPAAPDVVIAGSGDVVLAAFDGENGASDLAEPPAAAPVTAAAADFRIQLATLRDAGNAAYVWRDFETRFAPFAADLPRHLVRRETSRGVFHLVQVGSFEQAHPAETICGTIRKGGGDCIVVREPAPGS